MDLTLKKKSNFNLLDLLSIILIAFQFDLFYLISTNFKLGQGILFLVSLIVIVRFIRHPLSGKDLNLYLILFLFVLLVTGAYQVTNMFGGSVISAFLAERILWVYIAFYFAFDKLYMTGVFDKERCLKLLKCVGVIQLVLYFTQWILSSKIIFLHVLSGSRYGSARFYFSPILLIFLVCFCVSDFYSSKKISKIRNSVIWIVLIVAEILIVQKYRMTAVALAVAIIVGFVMYKGNIKKGLLILLLALLVILVLLNTPMGKDIINSVMNSGTDNSVKGRAAWRLWALDELKQRPLFGNGFVYSTEAYEYGASFVRKYFSWSFTPNDYGIMGFIYQYGLLGAIWFVLFVAVQLRRSLYVWRHNNNYAYLVFLVFIVVDSYSELYWIMSNGLFVLVIYMVMLKNEFEQTKSRIRDSYQNMKTVVADKDLNMESER